MSEQQYQNLEIGKGRMTLHCGGQPATFEEVAEVELPIATESYVPVGHADVVRLLRREVKARMPEYELREGFALNKHGAQFFGIMALYAPDVDEHGLTIGYRNSYDKSMSIAVATGLSVWLCDNLAFSGEAMEVIRKHTGNVWENFEQMGMQAVLHAQEHFDKTHGELLRMKRIPVSKDDGFGELGRLVGAGVLQPSLFNEACREWRQKDHAQFPERNLYRLYNNVTEALKKVSVARALSRYTGLHEHIRSRFDIEPKAVTVLDPKPH